MASDAQLEAFDDTQLQGENGEMALFQWLSSTEKDLKSVSVELLKRRQADLEGTMVKVITASEHFPPPGRLLRHAVARCLLVIYSRGETRTLFDTLGLFLKAAADYKAADRDIHKTAALYCVGELMGTFGAQFMSHMAEIVTTTMKTFKSSNSPLLRFHALGALRKSLTSARKAVTEAAMKDITKQAKYGLTDKLLPIQRAAADVLMVVYATREDISLPDTESIVTTCTKALEQSDRVTCRTHARLVGHLFALTQVEYTVAPTEPSTKGKDKAGEEAAEDAIPPAALAEAAKKTMLSPSDMLCQLSSQFNKPHASRKTRQGVSEFYSALLIALGAAFVESNYHTIVNHFMVEIVSNPRNSHSRYETLLVRASIGVMLRELIGVRMLTEQGQISAIQDLSASYLKRWPAMMPGQVAPNPMVLTIVLKEVAELLQQLGNTPPPVQDAVSEPLVTLLAHTTHTVRVNAAWALRCFCYSTPLRLPKVILVTIELLQRDLNSLLSPAAPADVHLRALGHAYGLASLVSIIPERPLYVSYDISAKVLDMAIQLLKRAGEHEVRIADIEVEVAWTCIASLMLLGPNFVRPHLPQLLVLWRNALPKPTSKDAASSSGRSAAEWSFLLHVRECALGAVWCFLRHNASLVTLDVARRVASLLTNALLFANAFVTQDSPSDTSRENDSQNRSVKSREALLRRRVYQCFTSLGFSGITDSTQATLLHSAVSLFASPDVYNNSVQAAIASSSGAFTSIWQSNDGYAYGVTSIDFAESSEAEGDSSSRPSEGGGSKREGFEASLDDLIGRPILGGREHDPLSLCQGQASSTAHTRRSSEPPPSATAVVDAAIELFSDLLPRQDAASTSKTLSQLLEFVRSSKLEKTAGRKAAVLVNATIAVGLFLRNASVNHFRHARAILSSSDLTSMISSFLKSTLVEGDQVLRTISSEAIGRLAALAGTSFITNQIKGLVDQVVNNRDPHGRAGCALAFGSIYAHVGGLAAGPLLKTIVNVLMSLVNDPHPVVHFWALAALCRVINAASLAYAPFVSGTLGMLLKACLLESHEPEGGSMTNANLSGDLPSYPVMCRIIDAVINILGPDIQESQRTRNLVLNLIHEFSVEESEEIAVEAVNCIQHFLMFAPQHVEIAELVDRFREYLSSTRRPLKFASINALYQLVQRDAMAMSKLGGDRLVEDLFGMLDDDSSVDGVRNVISSWLKQTVIYNPSAWIDLCQRIMSRTTASQQVANASANPGGARDDEGESLSLGASTGDASESRGYSTSRWRTQLFALQCLHDICLIVSLSGRKEHFDIPLARARGLPTSGLLVSRVPDLIKMAFTASTAYVTEIRLEGLLLLQDVIKIFAASPDPAYEDALLLEQHQAPITAALTPAFSADSTPEILASAVQACAIFVGCGVVKDVRKMGRILKLLTTALDQSKETGMLSLGDSGEMSPNASAMLRISTVSAWAELEVASPRQTYLQDVIKPHRATLATLWIGTLRDYASLRADSEVVNETSSVGLDSSYSSLGKEVLLPYYLDSWPVILEAVATSMEAEEPHIRAAMNGGQQVDGSVSLHREEPCAFFFILFGLVYEALATSSTDTSATSSSRNPAIAASLKALKCLVQPEYSGKSLVGTPTFEELISLAYRMAMTETAAVQALLIGFVSQLAVVELRREKDTVRKSDESDPLAPGSAKTHCLRICAFVARHTSSKGIGTTASAISDRLRATTKALEAFCAIGTAMESDYREDVRGVGVLLYSELLQDETSEIDIAGPTLPALKLLLTFPLAESAAARLRYERLVHGLFSACLLNVDIMQGRDGPISLRKIKNNLLAAVLVLTVVPPSIKISLGAVEHCCFLISQKLLETIDMSIVAAHCAKTIVVAANAGTPLLHQCIRLLLPAILEFVAKTVSSVRDDGSIDDHQMTAIGEIFKAMQGVFAAVPEAHRVRMLGVLLPAITLLLRLPENTQTALHSQSVAQLLAYAASSPAAFKEAVAGLDTPLKDLLEQSIRRHVQTSSAAGVAQQSARPQISLRSF